MLGCLVRTQALPGRNAHYHVQCEHHSYTPHSKHYINAHGKPCISCPAVVLLHPQSPHSLHTSQHHQRLFTQKIIVWKAKVRSMRTENEYREEDRRKSRSCGSVPGQEGEVLFGGVPIAVQAYTLHKHPLSYDLTVRKRWSCSLRVSSFSACVFGEAHEGLLHCFPADWRRSISVGKQETA